MDSTTSSRARSVAWPSLTTPSILQVRGLADELRELRQQGEPFPVRVVLERHPELATVKSVVIELANEDLCQRSESGEKIDLQAYFKHLPVFQDEVRKMAEAHGWVEEKGPLLDEHLPAAFPEIGKEFLGFTLLRELGKGSFACVYLAAEPALGNRLVAVKVSRHANAEAEILGRLTHRNIVPIHSAQRDPRTGFTVVCMPYLGSATLCDLLSHIRMPAGLPTKARAIVDSSQDRVAADYLELGNQVPEPILQKGTYVDGVLRLGIQLAEALEFIHSLGICHCDLKPSNVLMSPDGRPRLLDFNLAFREQAAHKRLGGTIPYMSPEFLRAMDPGRVGFPAQVDARSDVFSLGVMLSELLTGRHPFGSFEITDDYEAMRKGILEQQSNGARAEWSLNPRVDSQITHLLDMCLEFRPEDRPQTAGELAKQLRKSLSARRRLQRWISLNFRLLVASAALLSASLFLGILFAIPKEPYGVRQFNKGLDLYHQGRFDEAREYFIRSVRADPDNPDAQFALGRTFQNMKLFAPATDAYLAADRLRREGRVEACMGYCAAHLGYHDEAIAYQDSAIDQGFTTAQTYNNRGYSWLKKKKLENAEGDFLKASELDNSLQAPYFNLALLQLIRAYQEQDHKSACQRGITHIEKALEIGPDRADLYYTAAKLNSIAAEKDSANFAPALMYLEKAILMGLNPSELANDASAFKALSDLPRFKRMATTPSPAFPATETNRLLDPVAN